MHMASYSAFRCAQLLQKCCHASCNVKTWLRTGFLSVMNLPDLGRAREVHHVQQSIHL